MITLFVCFTFLTVIHGFYPNPTTDFLNNEITIDVNETRKLLVE